MINALGIAALYLLGLHLFSIPLTGDQRVYVATAYEMLRIHEWRWGVLFEQWSFIKPPFQYWATILSWKVFGFSWWATLLPSVVALFVTVRALDALTFEISPDRPGGTRRPPLAGLVFAATLGAMTFATTAQMEIHLVALGTVAWWAGVRYLRTEENALLFLSLVSAGLLSIVKSPLYSVLWCVSFLCFVLLQRRFDVLRRPRVWIALAVGVLIGSAWYAHAWWRAGEAFVHEFVMKESYFKQITGNNLSASGLWGAFLVQGLPWTFLVLAAAVGAGMSSKVRRRILLGVQDYKRHLTPGDRRFWQLVFAMIVVSGAFFSWFPYRVSTYLFFVLPALGLIVDRFGERLIAQKPVPAFIGVTGLIAGVLTFLITAQASVVPQLSESVLAGWALSATFFVWTITRTHVRAFAWTVLVTVTCVRLLLGTVGEVEAQSLRRALAETNAKAIVFHGKWNHVWHEFAIWGAVTRRPAWRVDGSAALVEQLRRGNAVILSDEEHQEQRAEMERILGSDARLLRDTVWFRYARHKELGALRKGFIKKWFDASIRLEPLTSDVITPFQRRFHVLVLSLAPRPS